MGQCNRRDCSGQEGRAQMIDRAPLARDQFRQPERQERSLVTPEVFDLALTASTDVMTVRSETIFQVRKMFVYNGTGSAITFTLEVNGNDWYSKSIPANTFTDLTELKDIVFPTGADVDAEGNGLRFHMWGLNIQGGTAWL